MSGLAVFPGTNRTVRNCRVDATGCIYSHGVSIAEVVHCLGPENSRY